MRIKKPKLAVVDGDLVLFPAASTAQKTIYRYSLPDGTEVARFDKAAAGKHWLESIELMGTDTEFGYAGDTSILIRDSFVDVGKIAQAKSNYNSILSKWTRRAGTSDLSVYLSKSAGAPNFRHEVALRKPYKGNRTGEKPVHLEELRKWALKKDFHKKAIGGFETDDICCHVAQKNGQNAVIISPDKDSQQVVGCWVFVPDYHDAPVYSDPKIVGHLEHTGKKNMGLGWLFLLNQIITGDQADNYAGLDKGGYKLAMDILSPFNGKPIGKLPEAVKATAEAYRAAYGDEYEYTNKDGIIAVASWKDFFEESLRLAYMVKGRGDYPHTIMDVIKEM